MVRRSATAPGRTIFSVSSTLSGWPPDSGRLASGWTSGRRDDWSAAWGANIGDDGGVCWADDPAHERRAGRVHPCPAPIRDSRVIVHAKWSVDETIERGSPGHLCAVSSRFAGGCATTRKASDTMSPSFLPRAAYISRCRPGQGTVYGPWNRALPTPRTELDPGERIATRCLSMVFSSPEALTFRGTLKAPSGEVWRTFGRKLDRLPAVTTTNPDWFRYATETFQTARMEHSPGLWSIDFFLNGALTGTYRFWLGDPGNGGSTEETGRRGRRRMPERSPAPGAAEPVRSLRSRAERGDGRAMAALGFTYFHRGRRWRKTTQQPSTGSGRARRPAAGPQWRS